jgi:hypothetical protein
MINTVCVDIDTYNSILDGNQTWLYYYSEVRDGDWLKITTPSQEAPIYRRALGYASGIVSITNHNPNEVEQILGKALGYPWFKDDQENFPGATEADGVCIGEHVTESIAQEAANTLSDPLHLLNGLLKKKYLGWYEEVENYRNELYGRSPIKLNIDNWEFDSLSSEDVTYQNTAADVCAVIGLSEDWVDEEKRRCLRYYQEGLIKEENRLKDRRKDALIRIRELYTEEELKELFS